MKVFPWQHRKEMKERLQEEKNKTDAVEHEVIRPLRKKRDAIEHNGYAYLAAEGLGIIRRRE